MGELNCRLEAQFGVEQHSIPFVLRRCLGFVPFGHVDPYERGPGAFSQGFGSHRGQRRGGCLGEAVGGGQSGRYLLESVDA